MRPTEIIEYSREVTDAGTNLLKIRYQQLCAARLF